MRKATLSLGGWKHANNRTMKNLPLSLFALLALAATSGPACAAAPATPKNPYDRLAAATSVDCRFTTMAGGSWDKGVPKTELLAKELKLGFAKVNIDEGTADASTRYGDFYVVVRFSNGYLHLMQMFSNGPLYTTTVLAQETTDGRMMAIHTRLEYSPATVPGFGTRPETWYGDCAIGN
jgi:hypothetical protein